VQAELLVEHPRQDAVVREASALLEAARKSAKAIAAPTAVKSDRLTAV
jgi:hypothetical protein